MLATLGAIGFLLLEALVVWCIWMAIRGARTPQGSVGWTVFLLAAPFFAVPAYLVLGSHRIRGYKVARSASTRVMAGLREQSEANAPATPPGIAPGPFEAAARMPVVGGNAMELLVDGTETFAAIFAAIDSAERYVLVQFYILRDDGLGRRLRDCLVRACERGVDVYLLFDGVGSNKLPNGWLHPLRTVGANVVDPRDTPGPRSRLRINFRNHRKTVVIDGVVGFIGGHNVGDEYLGLDPKFGRWRDTHVQLRGPVVTQLQLVFAEDWHYATRDTLRDELIWRADPHENDMSALIVATGPTDTLEGGSLLFFSAISAAQERIWIATPYFVPDVDILAALKNAALRGVEVRILVPDMVDHWMPWLAAFAYFDEVLDTGVEIWRYSGGFLHQKVFVVDDGLAAVGTANMDNRSFRLNFEAMVLMFDPRVAAEIEEMLAIDFAQSSRLDRRLSGQRLYVRVGAPVARLFAPLL